jgi:hypothetical protein
VPDPHTAPLASPLLPPILAPVDTRLTIFAALSGEPPAGPANALTDASGNYLTDASGNYLIWSA